MKRRGFCRDEFCCESLKERFIDGCIADLKRRSLKRLLQGRVVNIQDEPVSCGEKRE